MAAPFTDDEKRFILCEMIKQSKLDVDVLVNLVKSRNIEPDWWFSMHLPHGRTINQCLEAASDMLETTMERPSLKRKSLGDLHDEHATKRSTVTELLSQPSPSTPSVAASHPGTLTPVSAPARADCFFQQSVPNTRHVNIRPRPPVTGTPVPSAPPPLPPGPIQPAPTGRRRGRPPRADKTRQLRPLLPQNLAPLAPRIDSQPAAGTRLLPPGSSPDTGAGPHTTAEETHQTSESARTPGQQSVGALKAAKKRGRPPLADKTRTKHEHVEGSSEPAARLSPGSRPDQSRNYPSDPPVPSRPGTAPFPPSTTARSPSPKERAIPSISHLTREGLAR